MKSIWRQGAIGIALVMAGVLVGGTVPSARVAHGEIRETPPPQAFQTGGQLAVPVLKEIAATLRQIDSRLSRLETMAQKLQTARPATAGEN